MSFAAASSDVTTRGCHATTPPVPDAALVRQTPPSSESLASPAKPTPAEPAPPLRLRGLGGASTRVRPDGNAPPLQADGSPPAPRATKRGDGGALPQDARVKCGQKTNSGASDGAGATRGETRGGDDGGAPPSSNSSMCPIAKSLDSIVDSRDAGAAAPLLAQIEMGRRGDSEPTVDSFELFFNSRSASDVRERITIDAVRRAEYIVGRRRRRVNHVFSSRPTFLPRSWKAQTPRWPQRYKGRGERRDSA